MLCHIWALCISLILCSHLILTDSSKSRLGSDMPSELGLVFEEPWYKKLNFKFFRLGKRDLRSISNGFFVSVEIVKSQSFERLNLCASNSLPSQTVQSNFGLSKMHWGSFQHWIFTKYFFPFSFQISFLHQLNLGCIWPPSSLPEMEKA